ncbi:MAG: hypothetical protein DCC55_35785 [Chloroflexi bacterium]|nr:MAG: hypothetical protein DCC55_35785 [Chloroflexota bacterium]
MTLSEIIQDLYALDARLRAFELKYGVTSGDFYQLYQQGLLDDDGYEQSTEFTRWASAYSLKQKRLAAFEAASRQFVQQLKPHLSTQALHLTPNPALMQA